MSRRRTSKAGNPANPKRQPSARGRLSLIAALLVVSAGGLVARAVDLQVVENGFYQKQGDERFVRTVPIPVSRGTIFDRNGAPLAVSTPMESLWVDPQKLLQHTDAIPDLAAALDIQSDRLAQRLAKRSERRFVYLQRKMAPHAAQKVLDLGIPGVHTQREYQRFYPSGRTMAHVLGFTNIDGKGQEGLERSFNDWLTGKAGAKKVIRDGHGRIVENVEQAQPAQPGHDLTLSIDRRIQYLAWRELDKAVDEHDAKSAAMVIMNPNTGEVLAMVSLPSFNPNNIASSTSSERRNRAVTDVFEPGSTAKAFTVTAALESGDWTPDTQIDTGPGWWVLDGQTIHDDHPNGKLDMTGVITRSSNIGAAKIATSLDPGAMYQTFHDVGFGQSTESGYPGESAGILPAGGDWREIRQATIGYGYGFNVTIMQLAQAYSVLAAGGMLHHPTFIKGQDNPGEQVVPTHVAHEVKAMLRTVVASPHGTAHDSAHINNYSVAGKTGTSHQAGNGGYAAHKYNSVFAGMVPASDPELVGVVVVRDPQGEYFGTAVAAPVFQAVMRDAVRLLDIPPDRVDPAYVIGNPLAQPEFGEHALSAAGGDS